MNAPSISVILSVYNPDTDYFLAAVNSIIYQTCPDWELLLYDDGSDEPYQKIIAQTADLDARIRLVRGETHHSLAYGLNVLLQKARGKYIARMDADDISSPDRFQNQMHFLETHADYLWVGSSVKLINEQGTIWGEYRYPEIPDAKDFLPYSPYAHPSIMIRRKELLRYGGYVAGEKACRGEDYELFMRLHAQGERGYNLKEAYLYYRETKDSYKKRTFRFSLDEMRIRYEGFRTLGLKGVRTVPYTVKPLVTALIPRGIRQIDRKNRQKQKGKQK